VQRRFPYGLSERAATADTKHQKSARTVGNAMGNFDPPATPPSTGHGAHAPGCLLPCRELSPACPPPAPYAHAPPREPAQNSSARGAIATHLLHKLHEEGGRKRA